MTSLLKAFADMMNSYGPVVTIVSFLIFINGFFIWRDYKRESRQQKQLDELHRAHQEIVVPLLTECKEAIAVSKEVIAQNSQIITNWIHNSGPKH